MVKNYMNLVQKQNLMYLLWISIPIFIIVLLMTYNVTKNKNIKNSIFSTVLCSFSLAGLLILEGSLSDEGIIETNLLFFIVIFIISLILLLIQIAYYIKTKSRLGSNNKI